MILSFNSAKVRFIQQSRGEGNERVTSTHRTQQEAIDAARSISRNQESELVIHRPNGQIRDRDSHGKEPFPPKG
ncbi:DUF2188 domain-containing protein [Klebsiella pneumoniae]|nr:DUF2188 domain-containing protein [Klebsiella pneumoniae]